MFDKDKLSLIEEEFNRYEEKTKKALEKRPERRENFVTGSGELVNRVYSPLDVSEFDYAEDLYAWCSAQCLQR